MSLVKWLVPIPALFGLVFVSLLSYALLIGNPRVMRELSSDPQGTRADSVMLLGLPNGRVLTARRRFVAAGYPTDSSTLPASNARRSRTSSASRKVCS